MPMNIELARHNMIEQQVRPWDVLDERVLGALSALRREDFVPAAHRDLAFADLGLPLGHGEVMMKPVVEGRLLQAASPSRDETVLEIGTGSGFVTACLAHLAERVVSVELHTDLAETATANLRKAGVGNADIEVADAVHGYDPGRVFDVMVVTGATAELPQHWYEWIRPGGRIFAVVGQSPVQRATLYQHNGGRWSGQALFETDLPYLRHAEPPKRFVL